MVYRVSVRGGRTLDGDASRGLSLALLTPMRVPSRLVSVLFVASSALFMTIASAMVTSVGAASAVTQSVLQARQPVVGRTLPDTIVTITIPGAPGFFERLGTVASAMMAFAVLVLAVGLVVGAWHFRETYNRLNALVERLTQDSGPMLQKASTVADNVRDITGSVKRNVYAVEETIAAANAELLAAVRQTGGQIERFNALLQVVQDEAESAFVSTASAVRGVRVGLSTAFNPPPEEDDDDDLERGLDEYPMAPRDAQHGVQPAPVGERPLGERLDQRAGLRPDGTPDGSSSGAPGGAPGGTPDGSGGSGSGPMGARVGDSPAGRVTGGPRVRPRRYDEGEDDEHA
jgi:hypothetical protein